MAAFLDQLGGDATQRLIYLRRLFEQMLQASLRRKHEIPTPLGDASDIDFRLEGVKRYRCNPLT